MSREQREREAQQAFGWRFPKAWGYPPRAQMEALLKRGDPEECYRYLAVWASNQIGGRDRLGDLLDGAEARRELERRRMVT